MNQMKPKSHWRSWLSAAAIVVAWITCLFGTVWLVAAERAEVISHVNANTVQVADHEARLRTLEKQLGEVAADVRWIRRTLEQRSRP